MMNATAPITGGMEVAHRYHIPYVNTNGWSDAIREKGYPEVFNPGNYNNHVGDAVAASMKSLGVKRVVAFAENTDYGIGLAKVVGAKLKEQMPNVDYKYETLDRASKDFLPAILPLRANPPDAVIDIMTVTENLRLPLEGLSRTEGEPNRAEIDRRFDEMLQKFPALRPKLRSQAGDLSGGQQKMVEFAKAWLVRPRLCLIDEPSIGLAPKIVEEVFEWIHLFAADQMAILLVDHNVRRVIAMCRRRA